MATDTPKTRAKSSIFNPVPFRNCMVFVQEFVGDHDGLVEIAARVAPQVEDEFGGALRTQRIQRCLHLVEGLSLIHI